MWCVICMTPSIKSSAIRDLPGLSNTNCGPSVGVAYSSLGSGVINESTVSTVSSIRKDLPDHV